MTSYRYYSNIDIEDKTAAKEKNKRLLLDILSRLKEYFYPLAAKEKKSLNNQKLLQGAMRLPPGRRRQNQKEEEPWHY
ncbi:MAG: hypothetical protein GTN53_40475 [Candidatus Aminicenantes bacterium]|nr:hypothetical protein [Candidatus Aminicenantes bacterium]NIQ72771.1 hypothetical protein [Candidatus Aminicenantes bacterium]NIT28792.1 hypothetical protein [Candidatus Aminicenantes bacterium]